MPRIALWIAGACLAALALLAAGRSARFTSEPAKSPPAAPSVVEAAKPAVATVAVARPAPPARPRDIDPQVLDDAAAVGMTTREPAEPAPADPGKAPNPAPQ